MTTPAIITVAITGNGPTKSDSEAVPVTPEEQIQSAVEAFDVGATICHVHVRDHEQRPSSDPALYAQVRDGIQRERPAMVIQFSTGARGRAPEEHLACVELSPEMASLPTGSVNFSDRIFENPPQMVEMAAGRMLKLGVRPEIEVFDFAMLYAAVELVTRGLLARPPHLQLVMGFSNALPVRESVADFFCAEVRELLPDASYSIMAIGDSQVVAHRWALAKGAHVRTGLEDNLYCEPGRLARSNAELVQRVAELCFEYDRHPASAAETRQLLKLPAGDDQPL